MKRNIKKVSVFLVFTGLCTSTFGQDWELTGNFNVNSNSYLGTQTAFPLQLRTVQSQPILFQTANINRMYIDSNFIFGSTQMDNISGTSDDSRMFFNKTKGAFRAGEVTGTYWDADSSGLRSFAAGFNTKAVGNNSAAFGNYTQASGDHTVAMGDRTQAIGTNSIAFGSQSTALGSATFTGGISTTASGYASVALGSNSTASGNYTFSSGFFAKAAGFAATALGANTFANGNNSVSMGNRTAALAHRSVALGEYTIANHFTEMVLGVYNDTVNGNYNASSLPSDRLFTIGNGTDTNNRSHAITVLKNGRTAIGNITPQERLHVGGQVRIDTLLSGSPSDSIVTVGANGVLHKRSIASLGAGDYCTNNPSALTGDYEIPLGNFNYYFTGQASDSITDSNMSSSVGIGLNCGTPIPHAKLHVLQAVTESQGHWLSYSIAGLFENSSEGHVAVGVWGKANGNAVYNCGGYFEANTALSQTVGVYCQAPVDGSYIDDTIGHFPPLSLALYVEGDAYVSGRAFLSNPVHVLSDAQFKTNIDSISSALDIINQLNPVMYEYDTNFNDRFHFPAGLNYGFIAQEVETIVPELVKSTVAPARLDTVGNIVDSALLYKSLNYQGIIPILTKALQEQQTQLSEKDSLINNLNKRLTSIETCIAGLNLCDNPLSYMQKSKTSAYNEVHLKDDVQAIVLDQNIPNPFAEHTVIGYFLPEDVQSAEIIFHNAEGKKINNVAITERGKGELSVYADDLSSGIYTYTLIADGKVADTKRMVKR